LAFKSRAAASRDVVCKFTNVMIPIIEYSKQTDKIQLESYFGSFSEYLKSARFLTPKSEEEVWRYFEEKGVIGKYVLISEGGVELETIDFSADYSKVDRFLTDLPGVGNEVLLIWEHGQISAMVLEFSLFLQHWEEFYNAGSDDLFVLHIHAGWILYISHYETFQVLHLPESIR
jgi:hypothetical protein